MKKLILNTLLTALIVLISGCDTQNLPLPSTKPKINENLPSVDAATIKTIPDMSSIAIEWKALLDHNIKGYYIYRANIQKDGQKLKRIDSVKGKYSSHFLDKDLEPSTQYLYAISSFDANDFESIPSQSITANTKKRFESVSFLTATSNLPRQVKILWRPHQNERVAKYHIQKRNEETSKWRRVKTIKSRLEVEYIDRNLDDNTAYAYRIKAITFDGIKSLPSKIVKAKTKPLPNKVSNIKATLDLPRKITLTWEPLEDKSDVAYYKIYSSDSQDGSFKELAKAKAESNTYDNLIKKDGKIKFYKITTVDKDGLESSKKVPSTIGKTLDISEKPVITLAMIENDKVILNWVNGGNRDVTYSIHKTTKEGFISSKTETIANVTDLRFEDDDIVRGVTYEYSIEAVDINGISSGKTQPTTLTIPKLK